jgi:hypothetical protein
LRLAVVIGVAALVLVAFGLAMAAAGGSSGLAAVVSRWTGGREIAPSCTELHNVATLTEGDTHETRTAEAVVHLTAPPCPVGCVLTQGFWKTHPEAWPADYPPSATFFSSRKTWMQVLQTAPRGDAYYILAHQYIAAVLNVANGATPPAKVSTVIKEAKAWFETHCPGVSALSQEGQTLIHWAEVLAAFNEGMMGVPHCETELRNAVQTSPSKKGLGRPETPPGLEKRPETPPRQEMGGCPNFFPKVSCENREAGPATPPKKGVGRPETPPGRRSGRRCRPGWRTGPRTSPTRSSGLRPRPGRRRGRASEPRETPAGALTGRPRR